MMRDGWGGRAEGGGMRGKREKGGYYVCWHPVDKWWLGIHMYLSHLTPAPPQKKPLGSGDYYLYFIKISCEIWAPSSSHFLQCFKDYCRILRIKLNHTQYDQNTYWMLVIDFIVKLIFLYFSSVELYWWSSENIHSFFNTRTYATDLLLVYSV